jgi:transposase
MNQEDRSRLEDFRQFRKEVRGSSEYLLVGIDVAKDKHYAFFGTATGKAVAEHLEDGCGLSRLRGGADG